MGIQLANSNVPAASSRRGDDRKPAAKIWMNVGIDVLDPETGEMVYVSLGGIPIDTMVLRPYTGNSQLRALIQRSRIKTHGQVMSIAEQVEAGTDAELAGFKVRLRHAADNEAEANEEASASLDTAVSGISLVRSA